MTLQLFLYIVLLIIGAILRIFDAPYRYRRWGGMYESPMSDRIRAFLRRRRATRGCKKFYSKKGKTLMLKNSHVIFAFDTKNKTMVCINTKDLKQTISVDWYRQPNYPNLNEYDNNFELFFDSICTSFSESSSYNNILWAIKDNFTVVSETNKNTEDKRKMQNADADSTHNQNIVESKKEERVGLVNINKADEYELSKLPGINIVMAKKIISRVNSKGEYRTTEEMFKELKIKKHFQTQLKQFICARPTKQEDNIGQIEANKQVQVNQNKYNNSNDDRIVDI